MEGQSRCVRCSKDCWVLHDEECGARCADHRLADYVTLTMLFHPVRTLSNAFPKENQDETLDTKKPRLLWGNEALNW